MELPNTHAHTYGIHTQRHTHKKRKQERGGKKKERGRGMGLRGYRSVGTEEGRTSY